MQATRPDSRIPGWLPAFVGRRSVGTGRAVQVVLASAALTDILFRLLDESRAAGIWRRPRTTDIEQRLLECERAWEQETGERLSTAAFYDRFCAGDFDTVFGARWARYYEATLARPAARNGLSHLGLHRPVRG